MRPIWVVLALTLGLAYFANAAAEPPPSVTTSSTESSSSSSSSQESEEANRNLRQNIANGAGNATETAETPKPPKDVKSQPGQRNRWRRPFGSFFGRRPQRPRYDRRDRERERERPQQSLPARPTHAPTPDPAALTNFLAAAAFLLRNTQQQHQAQQQQQQQQQYANKFSNSISPPLSSNSISQPQQPVVGPFTYSQMSNVYKDGQPIPSQVFSSISGPSSTVTFSGPSQSTSPSGPSPSFSPSGFSPRLPGQTHYTNPNTSPFQPSSIASSFFSRQPPTILRTHPQQNAQTQTQDYEIAKSHYHPATVLPNSPPTSPSFSLGPTASSNLSPQHYALEVTSKVQTSGNPSAPGSIQYITPTPHKPYAVTIEPGSKFLASQMLDTNQLLSDSERYFKHYNKNTKQHQHQHLTVGSSVSVGNGGGGGGRALPPDEFLKTVSLTGGSSSGRVLPLSYTAHNTYTSPSAKFRPSPSASALSSTAPSSSFSPVQSASTAASTAALVSLDQKMSLLLNLVPHLVRSGALPVDSLLSPALRSSNYVLPPGGTPASASLSGPSRPLLSPADLQFLKEQYLRSAAPPPVFPSAPGTSPATAAGASGLSSLGPTAGAYYRPSTAPSSLSSSKPLPPPPPPFSPMIALKPSYNDFDTMYDLIANPSSASLSTGPATILKGGSSSSSSSMEVSDPVIVYHHHGQGYGGPTEPGHHPFAGPSSALNDDKPRSAIGSLLSSIRKLII